ncbi:hypothetical protein [Oerskovia jenensis]|uniref:hypothetical protein n=1 Tax=Oerskovia jenensis TaxID=162169 RepID=UPI0036DF40C3
MLASLLPGVRDLRTPLAVGVVLLLAAWVALGELIPSSGEAQGLLARVYEASGAVGAASTLAAAGFVAYLIGSAWTYAIERPLRSILRSSRGRPESEASIRALLSADRKLSWLSDQSLQVLEQDLIHEIPTQRYRLLAANKDIYDHFDRKESEAELRVSLLVPLSILIAAVAAETTFWALSALAFVAVLAAQGVAQGRAATLILTQAVVQGVMSSPALDNARTEAENEEAAAKAKKASILRGTTGLIV